MIWVSPRRHWIAATIALLNLAASASAELTIQKVRPDRIYYKPGEPITVEIEVKNPDKAPAAEAQLIIELVHDLDTAVNIGAQSISIEAGKTQKLKFAAKSEPWLGIEARATLKRDGKTLS